MILKKIQATVYLILNLSCYVAYFISYSARDMEQLAPSQAVGLIACCECGLPIPPNAANMCSGCLRSRVDITEGITRTSTLYICKFCERYFVPPNAYMRAELESKELLSICLKKLKPAMMKVRLVDACFVWTESHSKRVKVKMTVQKEVFTATILQQVFVVEFTIANQMCDDCRRAEAKDFWRACVQVRQNSEFKKTLFYLEQLILKHGAHANTTGVKPVPTGIDFFYGKVQDARKLVDFLQTVLPIKYHYAQELVTHDTKSNTYDYKHTFCVEIVPICRDNIVCLPKKLAQSLGNMSQLCICLRVSNVISLIDPTNLTMTDVSSTVFWREPFESLCQPKMLSEFYVLDVELVDVDMKPGHGHVSRKHQLADVWLVRSDQVGKSDAQQMSARTHLGHLLNVGDTVMAFDLRNCNVNNRVYDDMKQEDIPDVIIVKKVFNRARRIARRQWKLKRLVIDGNIVGNETASVADEFNRFMDDLEEDSIMREKVNIYKDEDKFGMVETDNEDDLPPDGPSIDEMLDDLCLDEAPPMFEEEEEMEE